MAIYYVDSTATGGANTGGSWADAFLNITSLPARSAGDTVYLASVHVNANIAASTTLEAAGTLASPVRWISADHTTGVATAGATIPITGASHTLALASGGVFAYFYGIKFQTGTGESTNCNISTGANNIRCWNCTFESLSTSTAAHINVTYMSRMVNCVYKFSSTSQILYVAHGAVINGGSYGSGSSAVTNLIGASNFGTIEVRNFDFTGAASTAAALYAGSSSILRMIKCKMPASWNKTLAAATAYSIVELINCDNAATNYTYYKNTDFGTVSTETTNVMTGGATDGTTPVSRKMVTGSTAGVYPFSGLESAEFAVWNDTLTAMTKTIEFICASTLKDNEIWFTVRYPIDSGDPLGAFATSGPAATAAGSNCATSSATWAGGLTAQKMTTASFTPQMKGYLYYTVFLAKASTTVYFNPPTA